MRLESIKHITKKILFFITFLAIVMLICFEFFGEKRIKDYLDLMYQTKKSKNFIVDLKDLVNHRANLVYIFYPETSRLEISNALGVKYQNDDVIRDDKRRIIIVGNDKILYEDEFCHDEIYFRDGEFIGNSNGKFLANPYLIFRSSKFLVSRRLDDDYYILFGK